MANVLDAFKKEEERISSLFQKIKRLGVHTMEGRNELLEAKDRLCLHLNKQFYVLYPELKKTATRNPGLKNRIENFETEMKEFTDFCTAFFKKYAVGGGGIEFFRDFEKLQNTLESRLQEEEGLLKVMEN